MSYISRLQGWWSGQHWWQRGQRVGLTPTGETIHQLSQTEMATFLSASNARSTLNSFAHQSAGGAESAYMLVGSNIVEETSTDEFDEIIQALSFCGIDPALHDFMCFNITPRHLPQDAGYAVPEQTGESNYMTVHPANRDGGYMTPAARPQDAGYAVPGQTGESDYMTVHPASRDAGYMTPDALPQDGGYAAVGTTAQPAEYLTVEQMQKIRGHYDFTEQGASFEFTSNDIKVTNNQPSMLAAEAAEAPSVNFKLVPNASEFSPLLADGYVPATAEPYEHVTYIRLSVPVKIVGFLPEGEFDITIEFVESKHITQLGGGQKALRAKIIPDKPSIGRSIWMQLDNGKTIMVHVVQLDAINFTSFRNPPLRDSSKQQPRSMYMLVSTRTPEGNYITLAQDAETGNVYAGAMPKGQTDYLQIGANDKGVYFIPAARDSNYLTIEGTQATSVSKLPQDAGYAHSETGAGHYSDLPVFKEDHYMVISALGEYLDVSPHEEANYILVGRTPIKGLSNPTYGHNDEQPYTGELSPPRSGVILHNPSYGERKLDLNHYASVKGRPAKKKSHSYAIPGERDAHIYARVVDPRASTLMTYNESRKKGKKGTNGSTVAKRHSVTEQAAPINTVVSYHNDAQEEKQPRKAACGTWCTPNRAFLLALLGLGAIAGIIYAITRFNFSSDSDTPVPESAPGNGTDVANRTTTTDAPTTSELLTTIENNATTVNNTVTTAKDTTTSGLITTTAPQTDNTTTPQPGTNSSQPNKTTVVSTTADGTSTSVTSGSTASTSSTNTTGEVSTTTTNQFVNVISTATPATTTALTTVATIASTPTPTESSPASTVTQDQSTTMASNTTRGITNAVTNSQAPTTLETTTTSTTTTPTTTTSSTTTTTTTTPTTTTTTPTTTSTTTTTTTTLTTTTATTSSTTTTPTTTTTTTPTTTTQTTTTPPTTTIPTTTTMTTTKASTATTTTTSTTTTSTGATRPTPKTRNRRESDFAASTTALILHQPITVGPINATGVIIRPDDPSHQKTLYSAAAMVKGSMAKLTEFLNGLAEGKTSWSAAASSMLGNQAAVLSKEFLATFNKTYAQLTSVEAFKQQGLEAGATGTNASFTNRSIKNIKKSLETSIRGQFDIELASYRGSLTTAWNKFMRLVGRHLSEMRIPRPAPTNSNVARAHQAHGQHHANATRRNLGMKKPRRTKHR